MTLLSCCRAEETIDMFLVEVQIAHYITKPLTICHDFMLLILLN